MKFNGGRSIYCSKRGDIVYESLGNPRHIIGKNFLATEARIKCLKFEERFKKQKAIPIKYLSEIESLVNFSPFRHRNGLDKYAFYSFALDKEKTVKTSLKLKEFRQICQQVGMILAYKNNNDKNISRYIQKYLRADLDLNEMWKQSMKQFMRIENERE